MNFFEQPFWVKIIVLYLVGFGLWYFSGYLEANLDISSFVQKAEARKDLKSAFSGNTFYMLAVDTPLIIGVSVIVLTTVMAVLRLFKKVN